MKKKGIFGLIPSFTPFSKKGVLAIALNLAFFVIVVRLLMVMVIRPDEKRKEAMNQLVYIQKLNPKRGQITDRNGSLLATSTSAFQISADLLTLRDSVIGKRTGNVAEITDEEMEKLKAYCTDISQKLSPYIGKTPDEIFRLLMYKDTETTFANYVSLGSRMDIGLLDQVKAVRKELELRWMNLDDDTRRYYPNNSLMAKVLGFTSGDQEGQYGVELVYNEYLKGVPGVKMSEIGADYADLPFSAPEVTNPVDGADVTLTLDENIQSIIDEVAREAMEQYIAKEVTIIVTKPDTGEILGLVNLPDYNPNNPTDIPEGIDAYEIWKNGAVETPFEPGSTFKIVTMAAALNERLVTPESQFYCPGYVMVDGVQINDADGVAHGQENLADLMKNSCNVGLVELGQKLGPETLSGYISRFGLGHITGIDLPGESAGIIKPVDQISAVDLATISFGQTNELTPIQIINNLNTILNYGRKTTPHVVKEIVRTKPNGEKETLFTFKDINQVDILDDDVCKTVIDQLILTVEEGGSQAAQVEGVKVLGKTGTAEKMNLQTGKYDKYISSFLGAAPAEKPLISVYIAVDSPEGSGYGSVVAAPMGKKIIESVLKYLNNRPLS